MNDSQDSALTAPSHLFSHVLLIEDNRAHALLITRGLKEFVTNSFVVGSAGEAFTALSNKHPYDLIISDLQLPDARSGEHLTKIGGLATNIPLVVLTSSTAVKDAVEAMKLGAHDFIVKEFDHSFREVMHLALKRVAHRRRIERERSSFQRDMKALQAAIENSQDGLAVIAPSGEFHYRNSAFERFVVEGGGAYDKPDWSIVGGDKKWDELIAQFAHHREHLEQGGVWTTEVDFGEPKECRAWSITLSMVGSVEHEQGRYSVLWLRDISEERRRERFQRELLSTTTHDLKGPLGAIVLSTELLAEDVRENKRASEIVTRIASSAVGATNLIDELLSARRIEEGSLILKPKPTALGEVVEETVSSLEPVAQSRGVTLAWKENEKVISCVDRLGMSRVFTNLVSNALKFTPRNGSITITLHSTGSGVKVAVTDTGCGMEPAEVHALFGRFKRLEKHSQIDGSGLGLFVVRAIVHAHGGRINVTSKVGQGSTFELYLPKEPPVNERGELICLEFE